MRLAKLHIAGFKSFPDRSELGFDHGVTAIVGPNGCGKSNVVDAITWVLGEQSAKSLRGERMEDVIFNGSDARKPTAAAEVRLKLTNLAQAAIAAEVDVAVDPLLDEQPIVTRDVEIGRRLYRSGESEYLIDGEVCRLRDVHDLLMDSGLGVKAYAVIEQGKIGQILSSRPAERRSLIEEAAGVTKYKSRRRSAELKLEAAQLNLTRIDDIVFEVEKQRGALKRQAARARRYKRLREELRRWEQVQFARRYETLAREIESAAARLEDAKAREATSSSRVAELESGLEAMRLALTEAESGATLTRERAHACELEIGRRQQRIQFDTQQIENLGSQAEALALEMNDLSARCDPARLAIESQREAADRARQARDGAAARVEAAERDYAGALGGVQEVEREADETRAAVLGANTTLAALKQARDNAAAVRDRVAAERARLEMEAQDLATEAGRARHDGENADRALAGIRAALETIGRDRSAADAELANHRRERERLGLELTARHRELAGKEARLRSLEELELSRATYGDAARFLLAEAVEAPRQYGAVADHLVVERSYERAVDALLGELLQHVLVQNVDDVAKSLAVMAGRAVGRCGFVVLEDTGRPDAAPATTDAADVLSGSTRFGGARSLRAVARATGPHAHVLSNLLGDALIVDSFDAARTLAREVSVPVAAMTGEVFRGPWRVEGGSRRDSQGILETRAEVTRLREEVKADEAAAHQMANDVSATDLDILNVGATLRRLVDLHHQQEKDVVALDGQARRAADELARVTRRLDLVAAEQRRADEEVQDAERRREEAVAAIASHEAQQQSAESRLVEVMARLQAARDQSEGRMRFVTEARTEQATLVERVLSFETEVLRLEEAARDLEARVAGRQADIQRTEVRREELRASIRDTEQHLDEEVVTLQDLKQQMRGLDEAVVALRLQFGGKEHDIRGARHALEAVRAQVMQSEVARATAASDLGHLASTCLEAVNATLEEVVAEVARMERDGELTAPGKRLAAVSAIADDENEDADDDGPRAEGRGPKPEDAAPEEGELAAAVDDGPRMTPEEVIVDLRKKIERLGPVNMMAIEQFDELEARHLFLTTQRKDLLDSIAQTGDAIKKIEKTTRERFEQAFAQINEHFQKTFTTLFGGGRAGLVLIDQEDSSESGIDIIASPPGKRLQNVQLLSGGEKAMTAMALMFAIFKYRPSPFCLLDEIDAPLDDANIGRFVDMLAGMQEHTQFILITHNRKTMEIADRLYGVTMEEPGVSKLISLQMN